MSKAKKAIRQVADGFSSGEQDRTAVRLSADMNPTL